MEDVDKKKEEKVTSTVVVTSTKPTTDDKNNLKSGKPNTIDKVEDSKKGTGFDDDDDSDWDLDNDFGDADDLKNKNNKKTTDGAAMKVDSDKKDLNALADLKGLNSAAGSGADKSAKESEEKKRQNLFFGDDDKDDFDLDIPEIGSNFQNKNEDKFNQVLSSSKEGGGLLASIGLKKDDVNNNNNESVIEDS